MNPCVLELEDESLVKETEFDSFRKSRTALGNRPKGNESAVDNLIKENFDPFQKHFHDNFESLKNMLCAFHSQYRLYEMISNRMLTLNITYDAILLLRPDTGVVFKDIDLPLYLQRIKHGVMSGVWTPNFQRWKGLNDRFAYGDVYSMLLYLKRGARYKLKADRLTSGSGEKFLKKYLRWHHIPSHESSVRVLRIRAGGVVARKDCVDEDIVRDYGEQLSRCVSWVQVRDSGANEPELTTVPDTPGSECRIRLIDDC